MPVLRRFLLLSMAAIIMTAATGQAQSTAAPAASVQLEAARRTALAESRNILVLFGASWCSWCKSFDRLLSSADAGQLIGRHLEVVKFTVQESPGNRALNTLGAQAMMDEWGGAETGLPFYVFLDARGGKIADSRAMPSGANVGYPTTAVEIQAFSRLLEQAAPRMTPDERSRIAQFLGRK